MDQDSLPQSNHPYAPAVLIRAIIGPGSRGTASFRINEVRKLTVPLSYLGKIQTALLGSLCPAVTAKYPKATECLLRDRDELLAFHDFPAQHWQSIRTSNPIESAFATIRHRPKRTKGCLSSDGMLHMMFKLGQCAEKNWRKLRGFVHLADVIQGVDFINGIKPSTTDQAAA